MARLFKVTGKNRYCGPGAIAMLTGLDTDTVAREIRAYTGKPYVKSTPTSALGYVLARLCATVERLPVTGRPRLQDWVRTLGEGRYAVWVTGHYVVVEVNGWGKRRVGDNRTKLPVKMVEFHGRRVQVRGAWRVGEPRLDVQSGGFR